MNVFNDCKGCVDRYPGCHSSCEKYKQAVEKWQHMKEYLNEDKEARRYTNDQTNKRMDEKAKKRRKTMPDIVR